MEQTEKKDYGHWNVEKDFDVNDYLGFVYRIDDTLTNRFYIGKKLFFSKVKKKPLKGKTRARRSIKESDWKTYTSSSNEINEIIAKEGKERFKFTILSCHKSKSMINYIELYHQVQNDVLRNPAAINGIINIRLSKIKEE